MKGFRLINSTGQIIRFHFYREEAPETCAAFEVLLPFTLVFMHARVSGQEIWTDKALPVDVSQENATVFTEPGEVVYGPSRPVRTKTRDCMGIYYGEGRGLDAANVFACVVKEDLPQLKILGDDIWKEGVQELRFEKLAE
jgi:hypothetical protein